MKIKIRMEKIKKAIHIFFVFMMVFSALTAGYAVSLEGKTRDDEIPQYSTFRDVPGVTEAEIEAIEALRNKKDAFIYGVPISTEAFVNANGEIDGFAALLCKWISELFEITLMPVNCEFADLIPALQTGKVDFAGGLAEAF